MYLIRCSLAVISSMKTSSSIYLIIIYVYYIILQPAEKYYTLIKMNLLRAGVKKEDGLYYFLQTYPPLSVYNAKSECEKYTGYHLVVAHTIQARNIVQEFHALGNVCTPK